jgi:hypothetical protein
MGGIKKHPRLEFIRLVLSAGIEPGDTRGQAASRPSEWKIVSYVPGESVEWEFLSGPFNGRGGYRLVPIDGRTEFTLLADVEPEGWLKLLGPVFTWMGRRQNQSDVEKLRAILESAPA